MKRHFHKVAAILICGLQSQPAASGVRLGMAEAVKAQVKKLDAKVHAATFEFINGASAVSQASGLRAKGAPVIRTQVFQDGKWILSPDKVRFRVLQAMFQAQGTSPYTNFDSCHVTYDRSLNSRAILLTCPFRIPEGEYEGMTLLLDSHYEVLVNDTVNNIYTDPNAPTLFSETAPAGGGQFVSLTLQLNSAQIVTAMSFNKTLKVGPETGAVVVQMVCDATRTLTTTVANGEMSFWENNGAHLPLIMFPFVSTVAGARIYLPASNPELNFQSEPNNPPIPDSTFRVFYESDGQPSVVSARGWSEIQGSGPGGYVLRHDSSSAINPPSYLGQDSSGVMGFATSNTSGVYQTLVTVPTISIIGSTTSFTYKATSTPPLPSSGSDYSSGVPSFTPDGSVPMILIAK